jgi:hypothetical protein
LQSLSQKVDGQSPFTAGASEEAATNTSPLSHIPHPIQISQTPANISPPARISLEFCHATFSTFHISVKCCVAPILLPLTITSSPNPRKSPLDHHRAVRGHGDGHRRNSLFSMFAGLGREELSIATSLSRRLQIDFRQIRDQFL